MHVEMEPGETLVIDCGGRELTIVFVRDNEYEYIAVDTDRQCDVTEFGIIVS